MLLKEGKNHHTYKVLSVKLEETELEKRLQALGLTEGSLITVLNNDKKGSMTVKFRGTRFAVGKKIADHIHVLEV
ncbi:MAG: FeoA family protein [Eubacteriales bacterium]|nr:FeoA family protein [Eubacteriales bacterium]